ncbi:MAG: recombinase family protein [Blautia faecis]|nr:recombinase family protein [Blautia faecis]
MSKWIIGKYIRLSRADQDLMKKENKSESESISHQKALIQNFINDSSELKGSVQYEFFDDGYSGTNFQRPSFERLLEKIKKGEINCVIVKDFSRFGRDYIELGDYLERIFPFMGVRFISINDHYDSADYKGTTGGLDVVMKNIVYDYYSKDLSVKVKTAKYQKMKQGKYLGGHVPYGLMKDPKDKHKLIIDSEAAAVVREIFDMAIAKMRIIDMVRTLNERGVETPGQYYRRKHPGTKKFINSSDKACWTHANLRTILKQEMYYGAIVGHKRQGIGVGCKHTVSVPKEEQFIVEGRHEGIITKEEFLKAQEIFCEIGEMKNVIPKTYPLYRKVKCGICGRAMSYKTYSRNGVTYRYFTCPHAKEQTGEDGCCKRYVIEDNLNEIVWSVIRQLLDMTDAFKQKLDKQNNVSRQDNLILAEKLARLQQEKEKCESDRFANVDQFMAGQLDKEVYQRRRADLGRLAEKLDADIAEVDQKLKTAETVKDDSLSQALGVMKKYSGVDELTQAMVQELIEKVVVTDPEHVEIVWKFRDEVRKFIGI